MSNSWFKRLTGADDEDTRLRDLEERLAEAERDRETLQSRLDELLQQLDDQSRDLSRANVRESGLVEAVTEAEQRVSEAQKSLNSQVEAHREEIKRLEAEHQEKLEHAQQKDSVRSDKLSKLEAYRKRLEKRLQESEKRCEQLEKTRAHADEEQAARAARVAELEASHAAVRAERDELAAERDQLTAESQSLLTERDALVEERDALALERRSLVTERDALRSKVRQAVEQLRALKQQAARAGEQLAEKQRELEGVRHQLASQVDAIDVVRRAGNRAEQRAAHLKDEWQTGVRLAAHACESLVGNRLHLAFELAARREGKILPSVAWASAAGAGVRLERFETHLKELGLLRSLEVSQDGIAFALFEELEGDLAVARWVAAFVTQCVNQLQERSVRLESLVADGEGFRAQWCELSAPRSGSLSGGQGMNVSGLRPAVAPSKTG